MEKGDINENNAKAVYIFTLAEYFHLAASYESE